MSATLRRNLLLRRRQRQRKRRKLRQQLAQASGAERQALEAKLRKTYTLWTAERQAIGQSGSAR